MRTFLVTIRSETDLDASDVQGAIVGEAERYPGNEVDHGNTDVQQIEPKSGPKAKRPMGFWQYDLGYDVIDVA